MALPSLSRLGLLPRIALALIAVGVVPLAIVSFGLHDLNRDTLREQVKRTHQVAVQAAAARVDAHLTSRSELASALAGHPMLPVDPRAAELVDLLAATLEAHPTLIAILLLDAAGDVVVRFQWPERGGEVDRAVGHPSRAPVEWLPGTAAGPPLLLFNAGLPEATGSVHLVDDASQLAGVLQPDEIGRDAELALVGSAGRALLGGGPTVTRLGRLPVVRDRRVQGSQVVTLEGGEEVVAAAWHLARAPWSVVSAQPAAVAEALARQLQTRTRIAVLLALGMAGALIALAWRSVVVPVRGIVAAQQELEGIVADRVDVPRSDLAALQQSFRALSERVRRKEALGRVFLGRYQVLEMLGEGAMGTVFRGWDPKLQRLVALKTIHLSGGVPEDQRRRLVGNLLREAVSAARFSHPHIVAVYDVEDAEDAAYVAMELVEGTSLERVLWERYSLGPELAVPLGAAIADALAAAHEEGLVHRDVKPANVLLGQEGALKVADFGIAAFLGAIRGQQATVFGTPGFLAPETARGRPSGPASDLFSFGVVLYQTLTGELPFRGKTVRDILMDTIVAHPPSPAALVPDLPAPLVELVEELLTKDPAGRPASREVARRLRELARQNGWSWEFPERRDRPGSPLADGATRAGWLPTMALEEGVAPERRR